MSVSGFFKGLLHLIVLWIVNALSLGIGAWLLPGITMQSTGTAPGWLFALFTALVLALVNLVLRPIVLRIAMPLGWVLMLVIGFLVNAVALWLTAWLVPGFDVGILAGLFGGIVIALINTILIDIFHVNNKGSWYPRRIEKLAVKEPFDHVMSRGAA
jgi:putative membrane protein